MCVCLCLHVCLCVCLCVSHSFNSIRRFKCCTSHTRWSASVIKVSVPCGSIKKLGYNVTVGILQLYTIKSVITKA